MKRHNAWAVVFIQCSNYTEKVTETGTFGDLIYKLQISIKHSMSESAKLFFKFKKFSVWIFKTDPEVTNKLFLEALSRRSWLNI